MGGIGWVMAFSGALFGPLTVSATRDQFNTGAMVAWMSGVSLRMVPPNRSQASRAERFLPSMRGTQRWGRCINGRVVMVVIPG